MRRIYLALVACLVAILICAGVAYAKDVTIQIVGGDGVPNGENPWTVAILDEASGSNPSKSAYCTGVLVDSNSVITAAHCLKGIPADEISIAIGKTDLSNPDLGVVRPAATKAIHPDYGDPCASCHDVGVLNFNQAVEYDPIPLGGDGLETAGRGVRIAGWGSIDRWGTNYPDRMQEAGVPIVGDERANNLFAPAAYVKALHVAAGRPEADTCSGDSGGPLFDRTETGPKLIGITSWGPFPCAQADKPGVYTETNAPSNENFIVAKRTLNN